MGHCFFAGGMQMSHPVQGIPRQVERCGPKRANVRLSGLQRRSRDREDPVAAGVAMIFPVGKTPVMTGVTIRPALLAEADAASEVLRSAAARLRRRGIDQWRPQWFGPEWAAEQIREGTLHVALQAGAVVGTLRLLWRDDEVWPDYPNDAGYVHSLACVREGTGLGVVMLDWSTAEIADKGRQWLRVDCWAGNSRLHKYYANLGFAECGDIEQRGPADHHGGSWYARRFQRAIPCQPGSTL